MALIEYVTGDLLESHEKVIVHGCNCQGRMGSGIAGVIRKKWPSVYEDYRAYYENHIGELLLGQIAWSVAGTDEKPVMVANAFTQTFCGHEPVRYVSYDAIADVFDALNRFAPEAEIDRIGMPLIGAGLANGSWKVISSIIETQATNFQPVVYLLDGKIPNG